MLVAFAAGVLAVVAIVALVLALDANALTPDPTIHNVKATMIPSVAFTPLDPDVVTVEQLGVLYAYLEARAEELRLWARWGPVNQCEQGGEWYANGRGGNGMWFRGGLGIGASLYQSIAGHSALADSPVAQMRVAEIVLARYGRGAWACAVP